MYQKMIALALAGLALSSCEPTPRTNTERPQRPQKPAEEQTAATSTESATAATETPAATEGKTDVQPTATAEPTADANATVDTPAATDTPATETPDGTSPEAPAVAVKEDPSAVLLSVALTVQDFNRVNPWEKTQAGSSRLNGIYLGDGLVLTLGRSLATTNYVEISLPDGSRTVPAKVLRYDADLNLGLLSVEGEEDATIFDDRTTYPLGAPLGRGCKAELFCTLNGMEPLRIPLTAEIGTVEDSMPRLQMRAEQAVPGNYTHGAPVVSEGKLVGISAGYNSGSRQLRVINAEIIKRFLDAKPEDPKGVPLMGVSMADLTDPVFRSYLGLGDKHTGVYLSSVKPEGGAAVAGLRKGDVLTSVEGIKIDNRGRCNLPLYGYLDISTVVRYLKPIGESLTVTYFRDGQEHTATMPLNRDAEQKTLIPDEEGGAAPRYVVWGGLVFQPLTTNYMNALKAEAKGALPTEFLELDGRTEELRARGFRELTALTLVVPTTATLGYDSCNFALVEKVNGVEPHSFDDFVKLLDAPTESGMVELTINKEPYVIYMEQKAAAAANDELRRSGIIRLRRTDSSDK